MIEDLNRVPKILGSNFVRANVSISNNQIEVSSEKFATLREQNAELRLQRKILSAGIFSSSDSVSFASSSSLWISKVEISSKNIFAYRAQEGWTWMLQFGLSQQILNNCFPPQTLNRWNQCQLTTSENDPRSSAFWEKKQPTRSTGYFFRKNGLKTFTVYSRFWECFCQPAEIVAIFCYQQFNFCGFTLIALTCSNFSGSWKVEWRNWAQTTWTHFPFCLQVVKARGKSFRQNSGKTTELNQE